MFPRYAITLSFVLCVSTLKEAGVLLIVLIVLNYCGGLNTCKLTQQALSAPKSSDNMVPPPELVLATTWILGHGLVDAQFVWPKRAGVVMFPNPPPPSSPAEEEEFTHCLPSTLSGYHYGGNRESAGIYHKRVTTEMTYEEAKAFCEADLAHLATFRTQEEYENLRDHTS